MDYIKYGGFTVPMPKLNKKETRGGVRQGSNAKPKYDELKFSHLSRKDAYYTYLAINFKTTGRGNSKKNNLNELMTFKKFIAAGICNYYRKHLWNI